MLGLIALDPVLVIGDARVPLATHEWAGGIVSPRGFELLVTFELEDGIPRWRWQIGDIVLEPELAMAHGRPAVGVVHRLLRADRPVRIELTPLCTWRNVHSERFAIGTAGAEPTSDGFVFENAFRLSGDGWSPGAGNSVSRRPSARGGGAWAQRSRRRLGQPEHSPPPSLPETATR